MMVGKDCESFTYSTDFIYLHGKPKKDLWFSKESVKTNVRTSYVLSEMYNIYVIHFWCSGWCDVHCDRMYPSVICNLLWSMRNFCFSLRLTRDFFFVIGDMRLYCVIVNWETCCWRSRWVVGNKSCFMWCVLKNKNKKEDPEDSAGHSSGASFGPYASAYPTPVLKYSFAYKSASFCKVVWSLAMPFECCQTTTCLRHFLLY